MRKALYTFIVPLLILEWTLDTFTKIWVVFHNSVKELTLALQHYVDESNSKPPDPEANTTADKQNGANKRALLRVHQR